MGTSPAQQRSHAADLIINNGLDPAGFQRAARALDEKPEYHGDAEQAAFVAEDVLWAYLGYEDGNRPNQPKET